MNSASTTSNAESRCSRCGAPFHCGIDDSDGCWCARLPALPAGALDDGHGCLCPDCMAAATVARPPDLRGY
jgi:hypothetical protein